MSEAGYIDERLLPALRDPIAPIAPPAALESRIFDAIAREAGARPADAPARRPWAELRWARPVPALAGAAALALLLVLALTVFRGGAAGELELQTVLQAPSGGAEASIEVRETGIGRVIALESDSLAILPKGDYYELWFVGPGDTLGSPNRISAGTFHPDQNGRTSVRFAAAVDPALYPVLSVTAEPGDGDPRPTGPEVLRGS